MPTYVELANDSAREEEMEVASCKSVEMNQGYIYKLSVLATGGLVVVSKLGCGPQLS